MGLEFINVHDKEVLYVIPNSKIAYFESNYFSNFNEKYNNLIDHYGTFRLEMNHLYYLVTLLECDLNKSPDAENFLIFISKCIKQIRY